MTWYRIRCFWMSKATWLDTAELIDAFRIFPRVILCGYAYLVWDMWTWVRGMADITVQQGALLAAVIGLAVPLTGWYMQTGRKWGKDGDKGASG